MAAVLPGTVVTVGLWTAGVVVNRMDQINNRMDRIEGKLDQQADRMNALTVVVETIKRHQRFQSAIMAEGDKTKDRIQLILSAIEGK